MEELNFYIIKTIFMFSLTYYTNFKLINKEANFDGKFLIKILLLLLNGIICGLIRYKYNYFLSVLYAVLIISLIFDKNEFRKSLLTTLVAWSINLIIDLISIILSYVFLKLIFIEESITIDIIFIFPVEFLILNLVFKIKKIKYGIDFLKQGILNDVVDLSILVISCIISLSLIIFESSNHITAQENIGIQLLILFVFAILSIRKAFKLYYKQKLLIKEIKSKEEEVKSKDEQIKILEKEILELSKKNHSFNHKYKSLEHKLNKILYTTELADEIEVKKQLNDLAKKIYQNPQNIEAFKTGITNIDDMLDYYKSECDRKNIEFNVQIFGNMYYMINNLISKDELEILIADHLKDAVIAIEHSENINRSILLKAGKIESIYEIWFYDSGIEFEKETLEKLGKIPVTTHKEEGGTGMGFLNTFDTLKKYNASLLIKEIGKPCKEDFTKAVIIKFDNKNEFKILNEHN